MMLIGEKIGEAKGVGEVSEGGFLEESERSKGMVRGSSEILETIARREEDGSAWLGYVRLNVRARKPER